VLPLIGCILAGWVEDKEVHLCPRLEAAFDPLPGNRNTSGVVSRTLLIVPIKVVNGELVAAGVFVGYAGDKKKLNLERESQTLEEEYAH
jgi:hypothetical protein